MLSKNLAQCALAICLSISASQALATDALTERSRNKPQCGDFLKQLGKKPRALIFIECKPTVDSQIHSLIASYKVKGRDATQVESYLIRQTGMLSLHRVCCIWENRRTLHQSGLGQIKSHTEFAYLISMGTGENLISQRKEWAKIDWFYVEVELPLESP